MDFFLNLEKVVGKHIVPIVMAVWLSFLCSSAFAEPENIAFGKKYDLAPVPNYTCGGKRDLQMDLKSLTDGETYTGSMSLWTQKGCVGWHCGFPRITIDLGKIEPISAVSFRSAFDGQGNVKWPSHIYVLTSDDGLVFRHVCDLVDQSWPDAFPSGIPPIVKQDARIYEYQNSKLAIKGRYVCFIVDSPRFVFCDEIKICRGPDELLNKNCTSETPVDIDQFVKRLPFGKYVKDVLHSDLDRAQGNCLPGQKAEVQRECEQLRAEIDSTSFDLPPKGYRATSPLNELHRKIFKLNAKLVSGRLHGAPLCVWGTDRFGMLNPTDIPEEASLNPSLSIKMMKGEFRSTALNLTNAATSDLDVKLHFEGLPGGETPDYIIPYQVEFICGKGQSTPDPLVPVVKESGAWRMTLPTGMTKQIWLSFNPKGIQSGAYHGGLVVTVNGIGMRTPFDFALSNLTFPEEPHLSLGVFDYTASTPSMGAIGMQGAADMKKHYVNSLWTGFQVACWPAPEDFDKDGNLVAPLRTSAFDMWHGNFNNFNRLFIYLEGAGLEKFAGEPVGTERFKRMVSQWILKFSEYALKKDVALSRIGLHLIDEPKHDRQFKVNAAYGTIIKAIAPDIRIFTDPQFENATPALDEMLKVSDVICPHLPTYGNRMEFIKSHVAKASRDSKEYWLYGCLGPGRQLDPYYYYRMQAWQCWRNNAIGMGFWCYWNSYPRNANATSWNELIDNIESFGLVYDDGASLCSSRRWEAVREGVEDYEYLFMLKNRVSELKAKNVKKDAVGLAEVLLQTLPVMVTGVYDRNAIYLGSPKERIMADHARILLLESLERLR